MNFKATSLSSTINTLRAAITADTALERCVDEEPKALVENSTARSTVRRSIGRVAGATPRIAMGRASRLGTAAGTGSRLAALSAPKELGGTAANSGGCSGTKLELYPEDKLRGLGGGTVCAATVAGTAPLPVRPPLPLPPPLPSPSTKAPSDVSNVVSLSGRGIMGQPVPKFDAPTITALCEGPILRASASYS